MSNYTNKDDNLTPVDAPPSYNEAINNPRPVSGTQQSSRPPAPAPSYRPTPVHPSQSTGSSQQQQSPTSILYTGNTNLPFNFPKGYLCQKCKNTGYKKRNGDACRKCWDEFYLSKNAYNPNPTLSFKYPRNYYCNKCHNTGYKTKNGKTCKDCWSSFGPRTSYSTIANGFNPVYFGTTTYGTYNSSTTMMRVPPGDPRLGGILCGRCRGSGVTRFFLDVDLCPICSGLGRVLTTAPPPPAPPVPPPPEPFPQHSRMPFYYPPEKS